MEAIEFVNKYPEMVEELALVIQDKYKGIIDKMRDTDPHDLIRPDTFFPTPAAAMGFVYRHLMYLIKKASQPDTTQEDKAFMITSLPSNPKPFINRLSELVDKYGSDVIKTKQYRGTLMTLWLQVYETENSSTTFDIFRELVKEFASSEARE